MDSGEQDAYFGSQLAVATTVSAQYGPGGRYGGNGNNFGDFGGSDKARIHLIAHGVLASLAFVILFPVGSILIRLGSFRGAWLIHGLFQIFAYLVFTAAVGIGIYMVRQAPAQVGLLEKYHPIIGLTLFAALFFQPVTGYVHHLRYKKHQRRTFWSYGHLWLGRVAVTLGIINGGLGLLLASHERLASAPSKGRIIAYGVVAGIMWLLYVAAAIVGERRRAIAGRRIGNETGTRTGHETSPASSRAPIKERPGYVKNVTLCTTMNANAISGTSTCRTFKCVPLSISYLNSVKYTIKENTDESYELYELPLFFTASST